LFEFVLDVASVLIRSTSGWVEVVPHCGTKETKEFEMARDLLCWRSLASA
jgi:hypothetical protein